MTYKELQGNTGGYKGLHEVTEGNKALPRVTGIKRSYRGLQGVTGR